jgi:patatin-related protein
VEPAFEQEIRFALVLYGGASLAVYIHGVTREFFHLVRSTAVDEAELTGTERVYRKLASAPDGTIRTRFLVDIASGTSAGGINAIFLGKAFANGQTLDQIGRLWLDQADATALLNTDKVPRSLLSGSAIQSRLTVALAGMGSGTGSPMQPEMDVFVTATDIQGLELPLDLADKTVFEKRHRNVFHLRFGPNENDFTNERDPFLAFAARATSAFPFAFEPACLGDIAGDCAPFFPDYGSKDCRHRAFGDGGYLDNKPFTHAIQALSQRSSDLPVERKLVYVEPSPDEPDHPAANEASPPPDFLQNSLDALITLPRQETIREDLERVLERNRLIERMQEIASHVEEDVGKFIGRMEGAEYASRTLADEIRDRGPGYAGYHRLKVRAVTDDLAGMLTQPREAVDAWRRNHYSEQDPDRSEARFLLDYDLGFRERRLRFLLRTFTDPATKRELNRIAATLKGLRRPGITAEAIADRFREVFIRAAADAEACLDPDSRRWFDQFEYYDQIAFPVFYEASVGEAEFCEVFRISPRDATGILDESSPKEKRRKLAGTALFHFGAFLKREWRENDLMWGRLDGAERIIRMILPDNPSRAAELIGEAHVAIAGGPDAVQRLKESYEVKRTLPPLARMKLGTRAAWILIKMLAGWLASI